LHGTAYWGGPSGNGTVFALNTNGTGFTTIYAFTATNAPNPVNSDGAQPLTLSHAPPRVPECKQDVIGAFG